MELCFQFGSGVNFNEVSSTQVEIIFFATHIEIAPEICIWL